MGKPSDPMFDVAKALNALALELRRYNDRNDTHIRQDVKVAEFGIADYGDQKEREVLQYFADLEGRPKSRSRST